MHLQKISDAGNDINWREARWSGCPKIRSAFMVDRGNTSHLVRLVSALIIADPKFSTTVPSVGIYKIIKTIFIITMRISAKMSLHHEFPGLRLLL